MKTELLKELGLETAAKKIDMGRKLKNSLALAYEHYRFVEPAIFDRFQQQLREKTQKIKEVCPQCYGKGKEDMMTSAAEECSKSKTSMLSKKSSDCNYCRGTGARLMTHDTLEIIALELYPEVPPPDCLLDLKKAKDLNIFDRFEVAKVQTVEVRPDPIIFGLINGCVDKFFITQWDDDVKIEDILKQNEG